MLIKIDVEGYEVEVIKGGINIISLAEIVIIETSFERVFNGQAIFAEVHESMMGLGFKYYGSITKLFPYNGFYLQEKSVFKKTH